MNDYNTFHIYDKIFKKILTLSSKAVINLINGLFKTNYPTDSKITYNWTEFVDDKLRKTLADTIITINDKYSYHMEAQMTKDNMIVFRVFEYGFSHGSRQANLKENELIFPEPMIIYLYYEGNVPDEYTLTLNFGSQRTFDYKVKVLKYLDISTDELINRKMIILIPFQLLKLRKLIEKERSAENLEQLKSLIQNDIIKSIEENLRLGNITPNDAQRLKRYTYKLYHHLYSHYNEMEVINEMTDESLILDIDIVEEELTEKLTKKLTEELTEELTKKLTEKLTEEITEKLTEEITEEITTTITKEKDAEIAKLQKQIEELKVQLN